VIHSEKAFDSTTLRIILFQHIPVAKVENQHLSKQKLPHV